MGDPRGFMKQERRVVHPYRAVAERVLDFREISRAGNDSAVREQASRCMDCGVAFCTGETGCPLGNLIPEWNELAAEGRWQEALDRLHSTNNFPEFTSRLCPAPCESACVLGLYSEAVSIKSIERQIVDYGFETGLIRPRPSRTRTGCQVAVIGSGPAGLAAAQELARKGHAVTVFEKAEQIGGLLRYGIPDFKLEKHLIDRRLHQLEAEGINFQASTIVGIDISMEELRSRFDAIALATGAEQPRDLAIPGRDFRGIHFAMDYLIDQNQVLAGGKKRLSIDAKGKRVIVIGGGDTGSDCIGTARRQGALEIRQFEIMPQAPSGREEARKHWPHWPVILRSSHAHEEGADRFWSLSTTSFEGETGWVTGLITEQVGWKTGVPVPIAGTKELHRADLVILALGFLGPGPAAFLDEFARDGRGNLRVDTRFMTSVPGTFAAGDVKRGASLIVWAIAEGRKMAEGIHSYLQTTRAQLKEAP